MFPVDFLTTSHFNLKCSALTFWVVLTLVYMHSLLGNSGDRSVLS